MKGISTMTLMEIFGTNVKKYRQEKKLSQESLADICGLHRTYISDIECFRRNISIDNIAKIAAALEIPPYTLLMSKQDGDIYDE